MTVIQVRHSGIFCIIFDEDTGTQLFVNHIRIISSALAISTELYTDKKHVTIFAGSGPADKSFDRYDFLTRCF
jgi:hypothetical protein